jgi:hypothetical protein
MKLHTSFAIQTAVLSSRLAAATQKISVHPTFVQRSAQISYGMRFQVITCERQLLNCLQVAIMKSYLKYVIGILKVENNELNNLIGLLCALKKFNK